MANVVFSSIDVRVRQARIRLFIQSLVQRLISYWAIALGVSVGWFLLQPLVLVDAPKDLRWIVAGSICGIATIAAIIWSIHLAPSRINAALTLDKRFELRERVTTALNLGEYELSSSAGQALLHDANQKVQDITVRERFPIELGRRAWLIPGQILVLVLLAWGYNPVISSVNTDSSKSEDKDQAKAKGNDPTNPQTQRPPIQRPLDRKNKSEDLKALETELDKLYNDANKKKQEETKPEQAREKVEQITNAEEKLKKYATEQAEKFQKLNEQLSKLSTPDKSDPNREEGISKEFQEALQKMDFKKAGEEVEQLRKKIKEKKMTEEEAKNLEKQLEKMVDQLERVAKNEQQQKKIKEMIDQAKKEGRNAEALERELQRLMDECEKSQELQNLAKKLGQCKKCLEKQDFDGLDKNLGDLGKQIDDMKEQLEDLFDADEHLQNLKQMRDELCKKCNGEGEGKEGKEPKEADDATGKGIAWGRRKENPDAKTNWEDQRQRGQFNPKGRKTYGGATDGPAFTRKTTVQMGGEIQEAVQEAAEAMEVQKLRKSDQNAVKEYFQSLGRQAPK
jgi:hypothetical protein